MEDRKSVLETTTPTDSLTRLNSRRRSAGTVTLIIAVLAVFGLALLLVTIFYNTSRGTEGLRVPAVER